MIERHTISILSHCIYSKCKIIKFHISGFIIIIHSQCKCVFILNQYLLMWGFWRHSRQ